MWSWQFANPKMEKTFGVLLGRWRECSVKRVKGKFLYSAISNPQDCSKRFTLYFPGSAIQSDTISTSLGSMQPYVAINARRLLAHISITCLLPGIHLYI